MQRHILHSDIVDVPADAMIYSTNIRLTLTGGVGVALLKKFGIGVQIALQNASVGTGRHMAEVGDVFETTISAAPWKKVFHTIATDELYHTNAEVVRSILQRCLRRCLELDHVRNITCSAIGSGYGDLDLHVFASIAEDVCSQFEHTALNTFSIVSFDVSDYKKICEAASSVGRWIPKNG